MLAKIVPRSWQSEKCSRLRMGIRWFKKFLVGSLGDASEFSPLLRSRYQEDLESYAVLAKR